MTNRSAKTPVLERAKFPAPSTPYIYEPDSFQVSHISRGRGGLRAFLDWHVASGRRMHEV